MENSRGKTGRVSSTKKQWCPGQRGNEPWGRSSSRSEATASQLSDRAKAVPLALGVPLPLGVPEVANLPLCQVKVCVYGLLAIIALRGCAVRVFICPVGLAWSTTMLSLATDVMATLGSAPLFATSAIGSCVNHRCLGSLLTLLLTALICDIGAAVVFLVASGGIFQLMGPAATDEGAPAALAYVGVWELLLLSSISMNLALCSATWQFYRAFREAGIYPPNGTSVRLRKEVSPLEFLCEAEDVALLSDHCHHACDHTPSRRIPGEDGQDLVRDMHASHRYPHGDSDDARHDVDLLTRHDFSALAV